MSNREANVAKRLRASAAKFIEVAERLERGASRGSCEAEVIGAMRYVLSGYGLSWALASKQG